MWRGRRTLFGVAFAALVATPGNATDCGSLTDLNDGWEVTAPAQEGLDPTLICGIGPRLEALEDAKAHGVVIIRTGGLSTRTISFIARRSA